jgi:hypothetical protein
MDNEIPSSASTMKILERINCKIWNKTNIHKRECKWSQEEHTREDSEN